MMSYTAKLAPLTAFLAGCAPSNAIGPDWVDGDLIAIDPSALWTWCTDERAIVDVPRITVGEIRGNDLFGSVGDVMCTTFDLLSGQRTSVVLGEAPIADPRNKPQGESLRDKDDHNTLHQTTRPSSLCCLDVSRRK